MKNNLNQHKYSNEQNEWDMLQNYESSKITLLAVDAHTLYTYWDISSDRVQKLLSSFGENVYRNSIPVLKLTNLTRNTSIFIRINDFSNDWYIYNQDQNSLFKIELGRKISEDYFISLVSSNQVHLPGSSISLNDHACFVDYKYTTKQSLDGTSCFNLCIDKRRDLGILTVGKAFNKTPTFSEIYGTYGYNNLSSKVHTKETKSSLDYYY